MKNRWLIIACCFVACLLAVGCATRKEIVQFKQDTFYLRQQVEALRLENKEIRKTLQDVGKALLNLQDENRQTKADLMAEIDNLKSQTNVLDSKLEDTTYRMSDIMHKKEDTKSTAPKTDSSDVEMMLQKSPPQTDDKTNLDSKLLYNTAYLDLSRGNYQLALQGFKEYLNNFPNSEFAGNAQYWIGETYYARGEFQTAFDEFKKVIVNYPRGTKVAAALLKMGYCLIKLNDLSGAKMYFNAVIQRFPHSEEAKLASSRLEELK